jgi:hypothetical protein
MVKAGKRRQDLPGELGAATSCPPSSEGAGRKRTSAMEQRAVLRPDLHGMEEALHQAYTRKEGKPTLIRYADDFVGATRGCTK